MEEDINYYEVMKDILDEKHIEVKVLEDKKVLKKGLFNKYKKRPPSTKNAISFANFMHVSWDYILNRTTANNFKKYKIEQTLFYEKFTKVVDEMKISKTTLLNDLGLSSSNLHEWKSGRIPHFSVIVRISKYLRCNIDDLLETE